jgi:hypothetical protein
MAFYTPSVASSTSNIIEKIIPGWAATVKGNVSPNATYDIAGELDRVFITGYFSGTIDIFDKASAISPKITLIGRSTSPDTDTFVICYSTSGDVLWASIINMNNVVNGSADIVQGLSVTTDSTGVYTMGALIGYSVQLYNGISQGTLDMNSPSIAYTAEIPTTTVGGLHSLQYIAKYDLNGKVQWVTKVINNSYTLGLSVHKSFASNICSNGKNIYITLQIQNDTTIYNAGSTNIGPAVCRIRPNRSRQMVLLQYDTNGIFKWVTYIDCAVDALTGVDTVGYGLNCDKDNVYITGNYNNSFNFYDTTVGKVISGTAYTALNNLGKVINSKQDNLSTVYTSGVFVLSYTNNGVFRWATNIEPMPSIMTTQVQMIGESITIDDFGNPYVLVSYDFIAKINTGSINGPTTPFVYTIYNDPQQHAINYAIIKYNKDGKIQWVQQLNNIVSISSIGGTTAERLAGGSITCNGSNVYFVSSFRNIVTLYKSPDMYSSTILLNNRALSDVLMVKYNTSGILEWATIGSSAGNDYGTGVYVKDSQLYLTGMTNDTIDFYNTTNPVMYDGKNCILTPTVKGMTIASTSATKILYSFIVKYNDNGRIII